MNNNILSFILQGIDEKGLEETYKSEDFLGKYLVIYFYPKDDTPGCTKESCNFNAILPEISKKANILGVSADNIASHKKFIEKYSLRFPLLSDSELYLAKALGAVKFELLSKISRSTFIFNKEGKLIKEWKPVNVEGHDKQVLDFLNTLTD